MGPDKDFEIQLFVDHGNGCGGTQSFGCCAFCGKTFRGTGFTAMNLRDQNEKYNKGGKALCAPCLWNKMKLDGAKYP